MHHLPAGPPLPARFAAVVRRAWWRLQGMRLPRWPRPARPSRRLGLGLAFTVLLSGLVLAAPVVSGAGGTGHGSTPVALNPATSSAQPEAGRPEPAGAVVMMGVDGASGSSTSSSSASASAVESPGPGADAGTARSDLPASSAASRAAGEPSSAAAGMPRPSPVPPAATRANSQRRPSSTPPSANSSTSASSSSAASSAPRSTPSAGPAGLETQLGALVALARSEAGCTSSDVDTALADLATKHSEDMRDAGTLGPLDGADGVVATGSTDLESVVQAWLADAGDRAALLDCSATTLGAGVANGSGGPWYTVALA